MESSHAPLANGDIARRFRQIADILEIQGENPFKVRAYRNAADTIDGLDDPLCDLLDRNALADLPGFGSAIEAKTRDFLTTGTTALWDRVKDAVPSGVVALAGVPGFGPKTARVLHEQLGVDSLEAAETAAREGRIRELDGFGPAKEATLLSKLEAWRRLNQRKPRWKALPLAEAICRDLNARFPDNPVAIAGQLRAGCDLVEEIQLETAHPDALPWNEQTIDGIPVRIVASVADSDPGVPWEIRHQPELVDAVRAGNLRLVEEADFRCQLHEHTTWSDGKADIDAMAEAALARGYTHLAITDHSGSLVIANGLRRDRLLAQLDAIAAANATWERRGLTLLSGLEADILADGSLDMDDDVLARLDFVVASVHIRHKEDSAAMTRRICTALENPFCDLLGHPSGRLIGRREAYPFDLNTVIATAARLGKALEINASPERMDLDDRSAAAAKAAGVVLSVNADAHSTVGLGLLPWGLCMARRAGLSADDVINTWTLERLREWVAGHRRGTGNSAG